jgi:hypothetical protein
MILMISAFCQGCTDFLLVSFLRRQKVHVHLYATWSLYLTDMKQICWMAPWISVYFMNFVWRMCMTPAPFLSGSRDSSKLSSVSAVPVCHCHCGIAWWLAMQFPCHFLRHSEITSGMMSQRQQTDSLHIAACVKQNVWLVFSGAC